MDLTNILPSMGVSLEANAFKSFGAAVQNQVGGDLSGQLALAATAFGVPGIFTDGFNRGGSGTWQPTPYAAATASGIGGYDPKNRFLFKVSFNFNPAVISEISQNLGVDLQRQLNIDMTYIVYHIDLPKYEIEYEDVNYYNFRTKVPKRITHEDLTFTMWDDTANNALKFFNTYIQLMSPITRNTWTNDFAFEDHGFDFSQPWNGTNTSMLDIPGQTRNARSILYTMTIDQYYLRRDQYQLAGPAIQNAAFINRFTFYNPRMVSLKMEEADYSSNDPGKISCVFNFDTLNITTGLPISQAQPTGTGFMETNDIFQGGFEQPNSTQNSGGLGGALINTLTGFLAQQAGPFAPTAQQLLNNLVGGGSAGGGLLTGVGGLFGSGNTASTLTAINGNGIANGISTPNPPYISDDAIGNTDVSQFTDLSDQIPDIPQDPLPDTGV